MEEVELGQVRRIVIAHLDRLVRFGCGWFEAFCLESFPMPISVRLKALPYEKTPQSHYQELVGVLRGGEDGTLFDFLPMPKHVRKT